MTDNFLARIYTAQRKSSEESGEDHALVQRTCRRKILELCRLRQTVVASPRLLGQLLERREPLRRRDGCPGWRKRPQVVDDVKPAGGEAFSLGCRRPGETDNRRGFAVGKSLVGFQVQRRNARVNALGSEKPSRCDNAATVSPPWARLVSAASRRMSSLIWVSEVFFSRSLRRTVCGLSARQTATSSAVGQSPERWRCRMRWTRSVSDRP